LRRQQTAFDYFRQEFNHERPHEALRQKLPAEFYEPSQRVLPDPPWRDFAYGDDVDTCRLNDLGALHWNGRSAFISSALSRELVGITWDGRWTLRFANLQLGTLKISRRHLELEPKTKVLPMSLD
jgi:hypothetical protein